MSAGRPTSQLLYEIGLTNHDSEDIGKLAGDIYEYRAYCSSRKCTLEVFKTADGMFSYRFFNSVIKRVPKSDTYDCPDCGSALFYKKVRV